MRVLIDPQIFLFQRRGGVSRLFAELAAEFDRDPDTDLSLPVSRTPNEYLHRSFPGRFRDVEPGGRWQVRRLDLQHRLAHPTLRPVDVVHHTWYRREFRDRYRTATRVSTVFDMIPEVMPEESGGDPHAGKRQYLEDSDVIICISETTRRDLIDQWGDLGKPIHVTHLGVDEAYFTPRPPSIDVPPHYVLFVGKRERYKNFRLLEEAFAEVSAEQPELHLVCVGGGPLRDDELTSITRAGARDRVHQLDVDEADLPGVYAAADLFVFPSKYEGFGLPILEAFAAGCPVIISDTPCLREIAEDAAVHVPADDPQALAAHLRGALDPDAARDARVAAGRERAATFTWQRTARKTLDVYAGLVRA